eukprot:CAMPEP_0113875456 /NCGR_PEP_ID=MMETSP0780_2-20120614/4956_1 /TAXON_ID=652834 /ORGANISM="Palpitomonas bilix" /LENGTH=353 /DNA_ID=CAMNT_0000861455 /DNA_START=156 /DNA_END=1217 /DNA_ORIENTATION=+ /assembly_acc=CAM_ASM_000599
MDKRKLFIGGIPWEVDEKELRKEFEKYGTVVEAVIMRRPNGNPRGFGFVTFETEEEADTTAGMALSIRDRKVEAKKAVPEVQGREPGVSVAETKVKRVFVGGIPGNLDSDGLKGYFQAFGEVAEAEVMMDKQSGNSRGFGFVTFVDESSVDPLFATTHTIGDKQIEIKKAIPRGRMDKKAPSAIRGNSMHSKGARSNNGRHRMLSQSSGRSIFGDQYSGALGPAQMGTYANFPGYAREYDSSGPTYAPSFYQGVYGYHSSAAPGIVESRENHEDKNDPGRRDQSQTSAPSPLYNSYTRSMHDGFSITTNFGNYAAAGFESSPGFGAGGYRGSPSFFYSGTPTQGAHNFGDGDN